MGIVKNPYLLIYVLGTVIDAGMVKITSPWKPKKRQMDIILADEYFFETNVYFYSL